VRVRRTADDRHGALAVRGDPYLFDDDRGSITGFAQFDSLPVPLPGPVDLVPRHAVHGYVLPPAGSAPDGTTPDVELVVEFDAPTRVSSISGIEIDYEIGGRRHLLVVDAPVVVCPVGREVECRTDG
jgi:hypothetical protein